MILYFYACGCLYAAGAQAQMDAPAGARCNHHRTEIDQVEEHAVGWVGLDTRTGRYAWTPVLLPWVVAPARIVGERLASAELGTVDGAMLRPVGGRRQIWIP